jgi:hypothetical protein
MNYPEQEKVSHPGLTAALVQGLAMALEGDEANQGWYTGLIAALENVSAAQASMSPGPGRTTVAAHAEHIRFTLRYLNGMFRGENPQVDWADSWKLQELGQEDWANLRAEIKREYEQLKAFTQEKPFWREQGLAAMIHSVAHTAYHAGAIRQMLKGVQISRV